MAISQNFPNTRPSLNLNFARSKTLDPRITFIRIQTGSEASYVDESGIIRYASADEPRFDHDPETSRCLGLMIEEQQTNLCFYGTTIQNFTGRAGATKTANAATSPEGTTTATRLQGDGTQNPYYDDNTNKTYTSGVTYTFSCFFKANGTDLVVILLYGANWTGADGTSNVVGKFDLTNETTIDQDTDGNNTTRNPSGGAKIESYPNGWYRCSITETCTTTHTQIHQFIRPIGFSADIYAWGYQIEADKDRSSLIPTTTNATVTRNSDNAYFDDISDFFNINEGTAVFTYSPRFDDVYNDAFALLFTFSSTANSNKIGFAGNSNNSQLYFNNYSTLIDGGSFTYLTPGVPARNVTERILVSYASTYLRMYSDELAPASTGSFNRDDLIPLQVSGISTYTSSMDGLVFGSGSKGTANGKVNLNIETFVYYPSEVGISNGKTLSKNP